MSLTHGGQLSEICSALNLDPNGWLDLSTGISPFSYPVGKLSQSIWRELPVPSEQLINIAKTYYGAQHLMTTSGSQSVIRALPIMMRTFNHSIAKVLLPGVGYKEHQHSWLQNGFNIQLYDELPKLEDLELNTLVVIINPNNPSTKLTSVSYLQRIYAQLSQLNGWLVIDEAFMDSLDDNNSFIKHANQAHCIVMRSVGKFFGLAGLRAGFAIAMPSVLEELNQILGPWTVNGPALSICEQVLADFSWQAAQKERLVNRRDQLITLLTLWFGENSLAVADLFVTVKLNNASHIFELLCSQKIYVRLCDEKNALRFGLPDDAGYAQLVKINFEQLKFESIISEEC